MHRRVHAVVVCAALVGLSYTLGPAFTQDAATKPAKAADPMAALAPLVGEWHVDGAWANGDKLRARGVYQWGLGKKILQMKTFVMDGDKEYQRYESIMAWHPEKKSLYEITFAFDGHISEVLVEPKGKDTLHIGYTPFHAGQPQNLRQIIRFKDNDHFVWTVNLKMGDEWKQLIEATWERKGAARGKE
jgi:hypothetical protein